jgi:hypothetical protein
VLFLQLAISLVILAICSFAPGFYFVRRLRWNPLEKLCGSVCLSLMIVWLMAWCAYVVAPGKWTSAALPIWVFCAFLLGAAWRDARRLFGAVSVRPVATGFGFLLAWCLLILATIRHYSGGGWGGDWLEHFQRTLVFLEHLPPTTEIFGGYLIPSRPPLAHIISSLVMAQTGDRFEIFQLVFVFINSLIFLPCCLMLPLVGRPWKIGVLPLVGIFATSPLLMVNATYTGAKSTAALFAVTAIAFYLRGWKKGDRCRMAMAFLAAAAGSLGHYSGLPYALFLGIHYLVAVFPHRKDRWKELGVVAAAAGVPLLAWFGWCIAIFGVGGTFMSVVHASVGYGHAFEDGFFGKYVFNFVDAIVPHLVRDLALVRAWRQPNWMGYLRDSVFPVQQGSLIFTMGAVGGPIVLWLLFRALRRRRGPERTFWLVLVPFSVLAWLFLAGERDHVGSAHLTLITMMAIGLTLLAANFNSRRVISVLIVTGCALDFLLGVYLQTRVEHLENTPDPSVFARVQVGKLAMNLAPQGRDTLSSIAGGNWFRKHQYALSEKWLGALAASHPDGAGLTRAQADARDFLTDVVRQDRDLFGGWFQRHGGEITFLGDAFGSSDVSSALLVVGCCVLLWRMARYRPAAVVGVPKPAPKAAAAQRRR